MTGRGIGCTLLGGGSVWVAFTLLVLALHPASALRHRLQRNKTSTGRTRQRQKRLTKERVLHVPIEARLSRTPNPPKPTPTPTPRATKPSTHSHSNSQSQIGTTDSPPLPLQPLGLATPEVQRERGYLPPTPPKEPHLKERADWWFNPGHQVHRRMFTDLLHLSQLALLSLASHSVGQWMRRFKMPVITGFLFTGILSGPYVLVMISGEATRSLRIVDDLALAVIAFAAGSELHIPDLRPQFRTIWAMILGLMGCTFSFLFMTMMLLTPLLDVFSELDRQSHIAISLLTATVLMARSPASAIAVAKELKATGPFTTLAICVSVSIDVVLVFIFSLNLELARSMLKGEAFRISTLIFPLQKIGVSLLVGMMMGKGMEVMTKWGLPIWMHSTLLAFTGFLVFHFSSFTEILVGVPLEPLLTCIVGSVWVTNYLDGHREAYLQAIDRALHPVLVFFFTLAGSSLTLSTLVHTWWVALMLFIVRLGALVVGSWAGGRISGNQEGSNVRWMAFVTQAGVGMGLAKHVGNTFPEWGPNFASMVISVIILNECIGPVLFRYALVAMGEAKLDQTVRKKDDKEPDPI